MKCKTFIGIWLTLFFIMLILLSSEANAQSGPLAANKTKINLYSQRNTVETYLRLLDSTIKAKYYETSIQECFDPVEVCPDGTKVKKTKKAIDRRRIKHPVRRSSFSLFI